MGVEVTHVHSQFRENYDQETNELIGNKDLFSLVPITFASTPEESKRINGQSGPCVIIASSPTCEFGRVLHHLTQSVENPDNLIVFCGWIPPETLGRRIQDRQPRIRIYDRWYDLKCQVRTIHGLSAHADGDELLRFLRPTLTGSTEFYVVHGEVDQAEGFAQRLLGHGAAAATVPAMETSVIAFAPNGATAATQPQRADGD
jgi:metallo-beta-lactamase family protein